MDQPKELESERDIFSSALASLHGEMARFIYPFYFISFLWRATSHHLSSVSVMSFQHMLHNFYVHFQCLVYFDAIRSIHLTQFLILRFRSCCHVWLSFFVQCNLCPQIIKLKGLPYITGMCTVQCATVQAAACTFITVAQSKRRKHFCVSTLWLLSKYLRNNMTTRNTKHGRWLQAITG